MRKKLLPALSLCMATIASAQVYITEEHLLPNMSSVTNEGVAVGYNQKKEPFFIWNPFENTYKEIGGISPGENVGGTARFEQSGKILTAPMECESIPVNTAWTTTSYEELTPYIFTQIIPVGLYDTYAIGSSEDGKSGAIFYSVTNGLQWKRADYYTVANPDGTSEVVSPDFSVLSFAPITQYQLLAGGTNGKLMLGKGIGGWQLIEAPVSGQEGNVSSYNSINFMYEYNGFGECLATCGCIGVELKDGTGAVWYTNDGAETFNIASDVDGVPVWITNNGSDFFMVTDKNTIQVSEDLGEIWTTVFTGTEQSKLHRIVFADDKKGVLLGDNVIYLTYDGGITWEQKDVCVSGKDDSDSLVTNWHDAVWSGSVLTIVGSNGCYQSEDNGETFSELHGFTGNLTAISYANNVYNIFGESGVDYRKENHDSFWGYTGGLYNVEDDTWTPLPSTGYSMGDVTSAPWAISGDGQHVAGLSYGFDSNVGLVTEYACVWNGTESITLLPNRFVKKGKPCRANALSYDGSVIVGWQDIFGPWFASIWRKDENGDYTQQLMTTGSLAEDEIDYTNKQEAMANLAGYAQCISDDGKWIGGKGDAETTGLNGAWIWNEETGYEVLTDYTGNVTDIANDGSMAIGWEGTSANGWIWTRENGRTALVDYVANALGYNGEYIICGAYDMSPNGRYICGFAYKDQVAYGYVIDLLGLTNVEEKMAGQVKAAVYPNPVADELHVDLPFDSSEISTAVTLVDMQGHTVRRLDNPAQSNVIDVRGLSKGVYVLNVCNAIQRKSFKVIVK